MLVPSPTGLLTQLFRWHSSVFCKWGCNGQVGHYKGELDHKGRRSGLGRMEDHQRVYRLDKLEPAVEMERNCFNSGESGLATKWRDLERWPGSARAPPMLDRGRGVEWCTFVCKGIGAKSRWYGRKLADPRWFGCARGLIHGNGRLEYGPLSSSPGDTYKVDNPFTSWQWHVFKVIYRRVSSKMVRWVVLGCTQVGKQVCIRPSSPPPRPRPWPRPRPRPRVFFSSKPPVVNDMISLLWKETWLYLLSFHEYIIF